MRWRTRRVPGHFDFVRICLRITRKTGVLVGLAGGVFPFGWMGVLLEFSDWVRHKARSRQWSPEQARGRRGEDLAHRFLRKQGYVVVARNYRTPTLSGEADIVAWEGATLAFVEVKTRKNADFGEPDRAVNREKQRQVAKAAMDYTRRAEVAWESVRFDVVTVVMEPKVQVRLERGAFSR